MTTSSATMATKLTQQLPRLSLLILLLVLLCSSPTLIHGQDPDSEYSPMNTALKEMILDQQWSKVIEQCDDSPWEAEQWDIGAILDNPRPNWDHKTFTRIYGPDDEDTSKLEWQGGSIDMSAGWGSADDAKRGWKRFKPNHWKRGFLALHHLLMNRPPLVVVKAVHEANESAIHSLDIMNRYPLHHFVDRYTESDALQYVINLFPKATEHADEKGDTPLHIGVSKHSPSPILNMLYHYAPATIKMTNKDGKLPIHIAAEGGNLEAVNMSLENYPESAEIKDGNGMLPLHYAIKSRNLSVVNVLLTAYPKGVEVKDKDNNLALHYASMNGILTDLDLLTRLTKAFPDATQIADSNGMLPLHWLAMRGATPKTAKVLVDANPLAIDQKDGWGRTPYWIAGRRRKDSELWELLELFNDSRME